MHNHAWRALLLALTVLILGALPVMAQSSEEGLLDREDGSVLVGIQNDVALPLGAEADAVIVVQGSALIEGETRGLLAVDADVTISGPGASVEGIFSVGGTLTIEGGANVVDVGYIDTVVVGGELVTGELRDIETDMAGVVAWLAAALLFVLFFIFIGWLLAVLIAALLLVAFGTVQARRAAANIGGDVLKTLVVGLLMLIVPWIVIGLLAVTVVGIPLAIGLGVLWAFVAFLGYLVVGLWIGERILSRSRTSARPYGAAVLGVLILMLLSWVPLVSPVATWFGLGAVTLAGWRVLRSGGVPPMPPGLRRTLGPAPSGGAAALCAPALRPAAPAGLLAAAAGWASRQLAAGLASRPGRSGRSPGRRDHHHARQTAGWTAAHGPVSRHAAEAAAGR